MPRKVIEKLSPSWKSIYEVQDDRDLAILEKIFANGVALGFDDWNLKYQREFDMTNDSHLFVSRDELESAGFRADENCQWRKGKDVYLPLYEGRMVGQFDFAQKAWVSGKGRQARWEELPLDKKTLAPQYLVSAKDYDGIKDRPRVKCGFLGVGSATNQRSMIACCLDDTPCGNSVPTLFPQAVSGEEIATTLSLVACLNSFIFDYVLRFRMAGTNLNYFVLAECPLPPLKKVLSLPFLAEATACLSWNHKRFDPLWQEFMHKSELPRFPGVEDRLNLRAHIDASMAAIYGLSYDDFAWILQGGDAKERTKGFFRVDRDKPVDERLTVRALRAFKTI